MSDFLNWELTNRMHNLGYDGKTLMYIDDEEDLINDDSAELIGVKPAILTSAAFRWFREKGYDVKVLKESVGLYFGFYWTGAAWIIVGNGTYEEAELACLQRLIEIVESKIK